MYALISNRAAPFPPRCNVRAAFGKNRPPTPSEIGVREQVLERTSTPWSIDAAHATSALACVVDGARHPSINEDPRALASARIPLAR
jgi:hypothetical protein